MEADGAGRTQRRAWTAGALAAAAVAVSLAAVGVTNPWNLVVVQRALDHPGIAGLLVLLAGGVLWYFYAWRFWWRNERKGFWRRAMGFLVLGGLTSVWVLGTLLMLLISGVPTPDPRSAAVANRHNDVRAQADPHGNGWEIWLTADRGLWSREREVVHIGYGDSGPWPIQVRFAGPDQLVVRIEGELLYRLRFDPHDLGTQEVECRGRVTREWGDVATCRAAN